MSTRKRKNSGNITIADVAALAGVGTMTVSRALRTPDAVSEKLRDKIQAAVDELGYIPNQAAGALASGQVKTISVIIASLNDKYCTEFLPQFQTILNQKGYHVQLSYSLSSIEKEEQLVEAALGSRPSAIIIFGQQHTEKTDKLLEKAACPTLQISHSSTTHFKLAIGINHQKLTQEATHYLLQSGRKNIGFIGARNDHLTLQQQLEGWQLALIQAYHSPDHFLTSHQTPELSLGIEGLSRLLLRDSSLDALICSHEDIALGVLFECQRRHLKVPDDIQILCLDGGEVCAHAVPKIPAMEINYEQLAKDAALVLISKINQLDENKINLSKSYFKLSS